MRFKFTLAYLFLSMLTFALIAVIMLQQIGEGLFTRAKDETDHFAQGITGGLSDLLTASDSEGLSSALKAFSSSAEMRVLVLDEAGVVQADSAGLSNGRKPGIEPGVYRSVRVSAAAYPGAAVTGLYAYSLENGSFMLSRSLDAEFDTCIYACRRIIPALAGLYLLCAVMMLATASVFTHPLAELNAGIGRMSAGDFATRVNTRGMDSEFRSLAEAFNVMMNRVETLDRSRNSFVSNASHELKTPLATMKVMIESILYQEVPDEAITKEFLTDANNEIDRLSNIITDLLTLVSMDSGEKSLEITTFDLAELLRGIIRRLSPLARKRGLDLNFTGPEKLEIQADAARLTEVFINLTDNALKYTPRPGSVYVELTRASGNACVKVSDTGIGIAEEDVKHIFDRFYRVDKARSRATGGTGLGLSIVKQIILQHNGTITVRSKPEAGTTFTVRLPLTAEKKK